MEEDKKKKKRNKKNKNKQTKSREEDSDQNSNSQNINNGDLDLDLDLGTNQPNAALSSSAEEMINKLWKENETHVQKVATLQETIQHLQKENESYIQKKGTLEETIKQLRNECDSRRKKEVSLEESIMKLQQINDSHLQKEVDSEMNIIGLHNEKELLRQEKALLEDKINQLLKDKAAMDLKGANLEESIKELENEKESWILIENSSKETISILNRDITNYKCTAFRHRSSNPKDSFASMLLDSHVVELEESRNKLSQENQQLADSASHLQLHIQTLERNITSSPRSDEINKQDSLEDLYSEIEAASVLVDKLIMENTELVEKVNELSVKLKRQNMEAGHSTVIEMSDSVPRSLDNGSISAPKLDSLEAAPINKGKTDGVNAVGKLTTPPLLFMEAEDKIDGENANGKPTAPPPVFVEAEDSGEIVQIPLDDTDVRGFESKSVESENNVVPLADAPLIGAPFRVVSFVARYVSGADLVNNTS